MSQKAIKSLCKYGSEALKPRLVNEKWCSPFISKRNAARIRKRSMIEGTFGSFDPKTGRGWYVVVPYNIHCY